MAWGSKKYGGDPFAGGRRKKATVAISAPTKSIKITTGKKKRRYIPCGMPPMYVCKMRYAIPYGQSLTSTAGGVGSQIFRTNSIYDPDFSGVGSQPRFRDQMALFYKRYVVLGARMHLDFYFGTGVTSNSATTVGVITNTVSSALTSYSQLREARFRKLKVMSVQQPKTSMTLYYNPRKIFGISKKDSLRTMKDMTADMGGNPTNLESYWHVVATCETGATQTVYVSGTIEYIVQLFDSQLPTYS